jgi:hypothetical protein
MVFVAITGSNYLIHQYKSFIGSNTEVNIEWEGKSGIAPDDSTAYLQIYNEVTEAWETIDYVSNGSENINFELSAYILDATVYKDGSNIISVRIYQNASTSASLSSDYYGVLYPIQYGDSYTDKGTTYTDSYSVKGTTFTDMYSDRDSEYIRNYPPNVTEKILNK